MYFCRLIWTFFLALFSSLSWSLGNTLLMPSGNEVLPNSGMFDAVGLRAAELQTQPGEVQNLNSKRPRHSYPISLKAAGIPVEAKQEIFDSGLQILTLDLGPMSQVQAISEVDASVFEQLLFMLSRSSKAVTFRFFPLTQTAEIETDQGFKIETQLSEKEVIRRDLPEPLNTAVANQLLLAATCSLQTSEVDEHPVQCHGGILERLDGKHVFFEASPNYTSFQPEWQIQVSSADSVELNLNATTSLILTLDDNGVIVKGDVIKFDEPSDMTEGDDKDGSNKGGGDKGNEEKKDDSEKTPPPADQGLGGGDTGASGGGDGNGGEDDRDKDTDPSTPQDDDEKDDEEEQSKKKKKKKKKRWDDDQEDACHWELQDQLMDGLERKGQCRAKSKPKDRSEHQRRRLEQQTGSVTAPVKHKSKSKPAKGSAKTTRR